MHGEEILGNMPLLPRKHNTHEQVRHLVDSGLYVGQRLQEQRDLLMLELLHGLNALLLPFQVHEVLFKLFDSQLLE